MFGLFVIWSDKKKNNYCYDDVYDRKSSDKDEKNEDKDDNDNDRNIERHLERERKKEICQIWLCRCDEPEDHTLTETIGAVCLELNVNSKRTSMHCNRLRVTLLSPQDQGTSPVRLEPEFAQTEHLHQPCTDKPSKNKITTVFCSRTSNLPHPVIAAWPLEPQTACCVWGAEKVKSDTSASKHTTVGKVPFVPHS